MRTVTILVSSWDDAKDRVRAAFDGVPQGEFISFPSYERLMAVMTAKRVDIVLTMLRQGPLSIREVARRVGRDVKAVHGDVQKLLQYGVLEKTGDGRVECPYGTVRIEADLKPAVAAA